MSIIPLPPPHVRFLILGHSKVAERTLERYYSGLPMRSSSRTRIEEALGVLGLPTVPQNPTEGAAPVED